MSRWKLWRQRRRRHRPRDERGASGPEFLIMAMVLFLGFTMLVQYGIRMHANRVAEAAAQEGAHTSARFDGTADDGRQTADGYVDEAGNPAVSGSTVTSSRSSTQATVTVTVQIVSLMPWLDDPITQTATVPVERFVEPSREFTNFEGSGGGN
ncbi:pilus assembly protein [Nocardioides immobilis]|uniref:Pilus assembly protein n=1 Tax=Nocardioides immobilis TaxID=2049295 RepID=A0A417Y719_9ACTN|nr:TadE family protein [Nocardioides immobilis]RHW28286.1 pilus assembly protein [Nocardioides immobilis]